MSCFRFPGTDEQKRFFQLCLPRKAASQGSDGMSQVQVVVPVHGHIHAYIHTWRN